MSIRNLGRAKLANTYTPVMVLTTNLAAASATNLMFSVSGSLVEVVGLINVDPTTGASYELDIPLPFSRNLAAVTELTGIALSDTALDTATTLIIGDTTNNSASVLRAANTATAAHELFVRFSYLQE